MTTSPPNSLMPNHVLRPALILGIENVIRRTLTGNPFPNNAKDLELVPGITKKIAEYRQLGYIIAIIDNETSIGLGLKMPGEVKAAMDYTLSLFVKNPFNFIRVAQNFRTATIHPFNLPSQNEFPRAGLFAQLEIEFIPQMVIIQWERSLYVGTNANQKEAAKNAGIPFYEVNEFINSTVVKDNPNNTSLN